MTLYHRRGVVLFRTKMSNFFWLFYFIYFICLEITYLGYIIKVFFFFLDVSLLVKFCYVTTLVTQLWHYFIVIILFFSMLLKNGSFMLMVNLSNLEPKLEFII